MTALPAPRWSSRAGLVLTALLFSASQQPLWATPTNPAATVGEPQDFWMLFWFGAGWFGFVILLLLALCSVAGLAMLIDDLLALRRRVLMPPGLAETVHRLVEEGEPAAAEAACKEQPSFLASVVSAGLGAARQGPEAMERAMEDAAQEQNAQLHRKIEYLNLLSSVAPMLGLLGTVWGMVIAFQRVAETHGRADPGQLAGGIYQALYTTVIGLVIAIPGLTAYGVLRNVVDNLSVECGLLAERILAPLRRARFVKRPASEAGAAPNPRREG